MSETSSRSPVESTFFQGGVIAYPTEAVFGLGCDPDNQQAVETLLALKHRPVEKGLILIAKDYSQLLPYVKDSAIPLDRRTEIFSSWPGAVTWLLPKSEGAPAWITGMHELIAVRVTDHPVVRELCTTLGKPIVSTSANLSGQEPARTVNEIREQFGQDLLVVKGEVGGNTNPSIIRNGLNGEIIRAN